jgi:hypothetical protein
MKVTIFASVDAAMAARLGEVAAQKRVPQSAIVAWAIQHFLDEHPDAIIVATPGSARDRDRMEHVAVAVIKANPGMSIRALRAAMAARGMKPRSVSWVSNKRAEILGAGVTVTG